ncbi:unnamed protein product [Effrenium voratum]|nr:unnamed protein product [Effrenium voratum]
MTRCASAGTMGAAAGGAAGAALGFLAGIIPAPLTWGLSVPVNAGIGSIGGMLMGGAGGLVCQSLDVLEIEAVQGSGTHRDLDTARTAASSAPGVLVKFSPMNDDSPQESSNEVALYALKGGLALGSVGASCGSALGGVVGAAVGLPPALLTMGLSIPFCATVGSGLGLCLGTAAGGSVGLLAGGLLGRRKATDCAPGGA